MPNAPDFPSSPASPAGPRIPGAGGGEDRQVQLRSGLFSLSLPLAGLTIGEIRRRFGMACDIPPGGPSLVDGRLAAEETVVRGGQQLLFVNARGEIGPPRRPDLDRE
ncbi:MAG: hypothetical protein HKN82_02150 [Akkermansiaceae bacterium]|nr:hypothetical protein [Akkermansiaceae bacterium]NNM29835.1 hypothetical protein [Akkermansiaceae bacterium]